MSGLPHACQDNKLSHETAPAGMFKRCLKAYLSPWLRLFLSIWNFLLWPPGIRWRPLQQSRWRPQQLWCRSAGEGYCLRHDTTYSRPTIQYTYYHANILTCWNLVHHLWFICYNANICELGLSKKRSWEWITLVLHIFKYWTNLNIDMMKALEQKLSDH